MDVTEQVPIVESRKSRSIIDLSCAEAKAFFLKQECYCTIELPPYFQFQDLLFRVSKVLEGKSLFDLQKYRASDDEFVNYSILNNKDGRHGWRPLQLIHPALYVSLVNEITEKHNWELIRNRFKEFAEDEKISCESLPVESLIADKDKAVQVSQWWQAIEQKSIELALDYEFVIHTDIVDCYGAIYTHSIAWAVHTKAEAKKKENRNNNALIGSVIDRHIRDMRHGQTNGIPQGSVLMDFIAEMVLGYADTELTNQLNGQNVVDYKVLRYRDDYRIFVNSSQDGERILKCLTEVMIQLGLKLSPAKTRISSQVVRASIKDDKLRWMSRRQFDRNLQKHLLIIHNHGIEYPNAGSLVVALGDFHKRIIRLKGYGNTMPLVSIVVDIAFHNPRTYPICAAILSKLISFLEPEEQRKSVIERTMKKFFQIPNTGHMEIWLQRISYEFAPNMDYEEHLCKLACGSAEQIWANDWISSDDLRNAIDVSTIIDRSVLDQLDSIVPVKEVSLFIANAERDS